MAELAAISLAANVLQVIGFTGSVVCKSWEYYGSASGVLQEYEDASVVAANLRALCVKIEGPSQAADAPLFDLAARCHATAKLLIDELDKLVVHGKKSKAQSLRKGLKAVWGKDESEGLAKRVTDLRAELKVYIAGDLRSQVVPLPTKSAQIFEQIRASSDAETQRVLVALDTHEDASTIKLDEQMRTIHGYCQTTEQILSANIEAASAS